MLDIYPGKAGAVTAADNLLRCLLGAGVTSAVVPMSNGIGNGWAATIFDCLSIVALPLLWHIMKQGLKWRAEAAQKKSEKETANMGNQSG